MAAPQALATLRGLVVRGGGTLVERPALRGGVGLQRVHGGGGYRHICFLQQAVGGACARLPGHSAGNTRVDGPAGVAYTSLWLHHSPSAPGLSHSQSRSGSGSHQVRTLDNERKTGPSTLTVAMVILPAASSSFAGRRVWAFTGYTPIQGFPKRLSSLGLPRWVRRVDAALFDIESRKTLFFVGNYYLSYDESKQRVESGYPKRVEQSFPGISDKVTAAFQYRGFTYMYNGPYMLEYDLKSRRLFRVLRNSYFLRCIQA